MFCSLVLLIKTINTYVICIWDYISFISRNIDKKKQRQRLAEAEMETSHIPIYSNLILINDSNDSKTCIIFNWPFVWIRAKSCNTISEFTHSNWIMLSHYSSPKHKESCVLHWTKPVYTGLSWFQPTWKHTKCLVEISIIISVLS